MKLFSKVLVIGLCLFSSMSCVVAMDQQRPADDDRGKEKAEPEVSGSKRTAEDAGFDSHNSASVSAAGAPVQKAAFSASTWQRPSRSRVVRLFERVGISEGTFALSAGEHGVEIPISRAKNAGTIEQFLKDRELLAKRLATLRYIQENIDAFAQQLKKTHVYCLHDLNNEGNVSTHFRSYGSVWEKQEKNAFLDFFVPAIEALLGICEHCQDPVFAMELLQCNSCPLVGDEQGTLHDKLNHSMPGAIEFRFRYGDQLLQNGFFTWFDGDAFKKTGLEPRLRKLMDPLGFGVGCCHPKFLLRVISDEDIARIKSLHPCDCLASFVMRLNRHSFMQLWSVVCDRFVPEFDATKSAVNLRVTELEKDSFKLKLELRDTKCADVASLRDRDMRQLDETFGRDDVITVLHDYLAQDVMDLTPLFMDLDVEIQPILETLKKVLVGDCGDCKESVIEPFGRSPNAVKALLRLAVHLNIQPLVDQVKPYVRSCNHRERCDILNDYYLHAGMCLFGDIEQTDAETVAVREFSLCDLTVHGALVERLQRFFSYLGVDMSLHQRLNFDFSGMCLSSVDGIDAFCSGVHFLSRTAKSLGRLAGMNRGGVALDLTRNKIPSVVAVAALTSPACALVRQIDLRENPLWQAGVTSVDLEHVFGPLLDRDGCTVFCDAGFKSGDDKWAEDECNLCKVLPECDVCLEMLKNDTPVVAFSCGTPAQPHFVCKNCFDHFNDSHGGGIKICHKCRVVIVDESHMPYGEYKQLYPSKDDDHDGASRAPRDEEWHDEAGPSSGDAGSSAGPA